MPTMNEFSSDDSGDQIIFEPLVKLAQATLRGAYTPWGRQKLRQAMLTRSEKLGLASFSDYAAYLRQKPEEWKNIWPLALAFEGSFYRPAAQFEVARDLLSEWAPMAPDRTLKVLSLGSGPGYEVFSLAMMLEETGLRAKNWQVDIYGLDINPEAVRLSESAVFNEDDLHWLTPLQRKKWFTPRGGGFYFKTHLAPGIEVAVGNVYEPETWPFAELQGSFDLIFARGLLADAPPEAPLDLARIISQALAPTGFIFTAPGEFLPDGSGELHLEERSGVTYYRRGVRRIKANRRLSKKEKAGQGEAEIRADRRPIGAGVEIPPRERSLIEAAEKELGEGKLEAARDLANEVVISALDDNRPSPAAWAILGRIEEALGRKDTARVIAEIITVKD